MRYLREVPAIEKSGTIFYEESKLEKFIEIPLLKAAIIFFRKGIRSGMSSANKKHIRIKENCYFTLFLNDLSDTNKQILVNIKDKYQLKIEESEIVRFLYPVSENTTIQEVSDYYERIANEFKKQIPEWAVIRNIEEVCQGLHNIGIKLPPNLRSQQEIWRFSESQAVQVHDFIIVDSARELAWISRKARDYYYLFCKPKLILSKKDFKKKVKLTKADFADKR